MSNFITATDARKRGQNIVVIHGEQTTIEKNILTTMTSTSGNVLTVSITDNSTMTESTDPTGKAVAESYYNVWQGSSVDAAKSYQMAEVIKHFTDLGYSIHRELNTSTNTTFKWVVSW
mgnify:CR=1 FL=1